MNAMTQETKDHGVPEKESWIVRLWWRLDDRWKLYRVGDLWGLFRWGWWYVWRGV